MKKIIVAAIGSLLISFLFTQSYAQSGTENPVKRPYDWWQADWKKDSIPGISLHEAYDYLKGRKSKTVVVAIIGEALDIDHLDLKNNIWTNSKEIPINGIDDDHNGFVDDIHGWCFVANQQQVYRSKQASDDASIYRVLSKKFNGADTSSLTGLDKLQYDKFCEGRQNLKRKLKIKALCIQLPIDTSTMAIDSAQFVEYLDGLMPDYKDSLISKIPFAKVPATKPFDSLLNQLFAAALEISTKNWDIPLHEFDSLNKFSTGYTSYFIPYGMQYDLHATKQDDTLTNFRSFLGDDADNMNDRYYGNPVINIPTADSGYMRHGTRIAGIIGARPPNSNNPMGIADQVLIMQLVTTVPFGGSEIKDVVNAIYYAVDNGAAIINISLDLTDGPDEHEQWLQKALDYAYQHHVIIVTGTGNKGSDLDTKKYISGKGFDGKEHTTYIRTGSTTWMLNDSLVSPFSNFGEYSADLFAPGSSIYTTIPGNRYETGHGTSFAAPMVAGVAALLESYYPKLSAEEVCNIIRQSLNKPEPDIMVIPPMHAGYHYKIPFSKMSKSGGIVNAYNAVKMADEMMNKNK